jgi:hypothetical protein
LHEAISEKWSKSGSQIFDLSGLGGFLICGKTAFGAAEHHSPNVPYFNVINK